MTERPDTIVAIATPPGSGGIGIIRISGPRSFAIARRITGIDPPSREAKLCAFRDQAGRLIDRGILIRFAGPHSFTGEDVVELQGHGGRVVMGLLLKEALANGARLARPGEFTERAWLNGRLDLVQAEAVADLIYSASERAARSAVRSLEGEFSWRVNNVVEELVSLRVYIEGALDFPEEEIDFLASTDIDARLAALSHKLEDLLIRARAGRRLGAGLRVAIIGQPNVGKSSLLNRLLQAERAIVSEIAGTTRDTIEETILIEGAPVTIVDTAGLHESVDPVEQEGMRRSREVIGSADTVILVTDAADATDAAALPVDLQPGMDTLIVHNKIDVQGRPASTLIIAGRVHVYLSARTGEGIDLLRDELAARIGAGDANEDVILARQRHVDALAAAGGGIEAGMEAFRSTGRAELLAEELRRAQQSLGEITGQFHNEQLLGEIFSRFCIGK